MHTFAIGDIHGRADLLSTLLEGIKARAAADGIDFRVVFLGDIIDRGPASKEAMSLVAATLEGTPGSILIRGNHDWFPVRILDELEGDRKVMALAHWVWNMGGDATLLSYGFDPATFTVSDLASRFPKKHLELLREAKSYVELPGHILVHAGIVPGVPLGLQSAYDLMWIKEPFLSYEELHDKVVVHGHTITGSLDCEVRGNRISIDTGAYESDRLSAAHLKPDGSVAFMQSSLALGVVDVEARLIGISSRQPAISI